MKTLELVQQEHNVKVGQTCGDIEPNVTEDTLFTVDGKPVGFYLKSIEGKLRQYVNVANAEFLSNRVPKSKMNRSDGWTDGKGKVSQFSTIIGSIPPRPHMRRPYPSMSSVHDHKDAKTFVKAMMLAAQESEELIKEITPEIYRKQEQIISEKVPPKWRFSKLFTSSISNYNIAADFHIDAANLKDCVNVIICKRKNAKGGNTTVPDYGATVDSADNSILVYPAWRNIHGVTPIKPLSEDGYRNTLVFYPLKAFNKFWD